MTAQPSRTGTAPVPPLARTPEEWADTLKTMGGRGFHAKQLFRWMHARGVLSADRMTDLPAELRAKLAALGIEGTLALGGERRSSDNTRKFVATLRDGATIETVLIPAVSGPKGALPSPVPPLEGDADDDEDEEDASESVGAAADDAVRVTQCISTQVGCAMGCVFCASGVAGLKRQLGADEIVAQIVLGRTRLDPNERLRNIVFMGMGEPLHNYEATARALRLITHPEGIALSARRVTVSTSGLVPEIARLGADFGGHIGLAVSLHAAEDETRSRLMPINKKYPIPALMDALRAYPLPRRRRITIEYTLVSGRNDAPSQATTLARLLRGIPVKVNLIPMNPIAASPLEPPQIRRVLDFQKVLCDAGYSCFIRRQRGDDVSAACGQLALHGAKPKVRVNRG
ncbi:MAG TPA: 23S rRNA (adenine(2503)-C(2))-methyltransferase RlmN [Polyangiaceae bacterium]|jgi:23S rRNA (adenine2503-C2)-methyltransferase